MSGAVLVTEGSKFLIFFFGIFDTFLGENYLQILKQSGRIEGIHIIWCGGFDKINVLLKKGKNEYIAQKQYFVINFNKIPKLPANLRPNREYNRIVRAKIEWHELCPKRHKVALKWHKFWPAIHRCMPKMDRRHLKLIEYICN